MKKQLCIMLVIVMCLSMNLNVAAYSGDDYLKVIERITAQSGFFEKVGMSPDICNGLIYGELIDFDYNGTEEMLLIYRDDNIVDKGFARVEIYAVVDGNMQCVFSENAASSMTQTDIGYTVAINNINGNIYFITDVPTPETSAPCNERIVAFTMSGGYPVRYEYYGEALDFWETWEDGRGIVYTKCMANGRYISEEEYESILDWLYYGARYICLLTSSHESEDGKYHGCTYARLQNFMSRVYKYADEAVKVNINSVRVDFDVPAQIINGRTMVPMRTIFEILGATVTWDAAEQTVTAIKGNTIIKMKIGAGEMNIDGANVALDVPAQIVKDRTLVPARAVAHALGCQVYWDQNTRTVSIVTNN